MGQRMYILTPGEWTLCCNAFANEYRLNRNKEKTQVISIPLHILRSQRVTAASITGGGVLDYFDRRVGMTFEPADESS